MTSMSNEAYTKLEHDLNMKHGALTHQFRNGKAYAMPRIVGCRDCLFETVPECETCCGTGREPIPFSEVWGDGG